MGISKDESLARLAEREAAGGVALTVLGFGMGNHNDAMLEEITNRADGNYAFIDSPREAYKVLVEQIGSTLVTIAKDVKIQVEFNPARVASYRLVGYANRLLAAEDFNDDQKDAGEIGAGHTVTALYEVVPTGQRSDKPDVDPLKYQPHEAGDVAKVVPATSDELLTVKLRYKLPQEKQSTRLTMAVVDHDKSFANASSDLRFAAAVASFGMLLRNSNNRGQTSYDAVLTAAESACEGREDRLEFINLVQRAAQLSPLRTQEQPAAEWPAVSSIRPYRATPPAILREEIQTTWVQPTSRAAGGFFSVSTGWVIAAVAGYVASGLASILFVLMLIAIGQRRSVRTPLGK